MAVKKTKKHKNGKTEELKGVKTEKTRKKKVQKKQETRDKGQGTNDKRKGKKAEPTTMGELLDQSDYEVKSFKRGQLVEGTVIHKGKRELLVELGAKSEGIITGEELEDPDDTFRKVEVGQKILSSVVQAENDQGYIVLSLRRAAPERKWRDLYRAYEEGGRVKVKVLEYNKGGLVVDVSDLRGFVPLSHLDHSHMALLDRSTARSSHAEIAKKLRPLMGQTLTTKVIEIDKAQNRLVLSEKEALAEKYEARRQKALESVKEGDVYSGVVSGIMPFGIFVRLLDPNGEDMGLEGLVHVSELSWERKFSVGKDYQVGDQVKVGVLEIDPSQDKLALSIKVLKDDPWDKAAEKYPIGSKVKGKVTKIVPYGAFVNLEPGLDGLLHVSETVGPVQVGEELESVVINLTPGERRMGLSVRGLAKKAAEKPSDLPRRQVGQATEKESKKKKAVKKDDKKEAKKPKTKKSDEKAIKK